MHLYKPRKVLITKLANSSYVLAVAAAAHKRVALKAQK